MDVTNLVFDRARRGIMKSKVDGHVIIGLTDIGNVSLSATTNTEEIMDARDVPIMRLFKGKNASLSGDTLFNTQLFAAQMGKEKNIASAENPIVTPCFDLLPVSNKTVILTHKPIEAPKWIYGLNTDQTLGTPYALGNEASATEFAYDSLTKKITLPTGFTGKQVFVEYEYESTESFEIENLAEGEPVSGEFIVECLFRDPCAKERMYGGYLIFPNGNMAGDVTVNFGTTERHQFQVDAMQEYCGTDKLLCRMVVVQE